MLLVTDSPISAKVEKMRDRVRWQHAAIQKRRIDQTRLCIDDGHSNAHKFSFLVLGDSGTGRYRGDSPQRRVAQLMHPHDADSRFILHTGDVVYLVGSRDQYFENFINPYREYLVGGQHPKKIAYDQMTFHKPLLPSPGNHDYYNVPVWLGLLSVASRPFQRLIRSYVDLDISWHGSYTGDTYARAFIDYLRGLSEEQLDSHLDKHYTAHYQDYRCLRYTPGEFTRLPNRYYSFHYGGIDFISLDSNTLNAPLPLPDNNDGVESRQRLSNRLEQLKQQKTELLSIKTETAQDDDDHIDDLIGKVEQIDEQIRDIEKQLETSTKEQSVDTEQLDWLRRQLIESWTNPAVRGRILYFHHPPYVTEATKWNQSQTLAVRHRLRQVFEGVRQTLGEGLQGRAVVDLVINGHAHCLEHIKTHPSSLADANINYLICGGSGYSLRRQRPEGPEVSEDIDGNVRPVAKSHLFVGRHGHGSHKHRPYSCVRIDVDTTETNCSPKITVNPLVIDKYHGQWSDQSHSPIELTY
ncbi:MAG: metallophosphoesterase [Cyanobacteria bacterium P01_A01_bin.15]